MEKRTFLISLCVEMHDSGDILHLLSLLNAKTYDHKSESLRLFQKGMQCTLIRGCTNARFSHPLLGTQVAAATEQGFPQAHTWPRIFFREKKRKNGRENDRFRVSKME